MKTSGLVLDVYDDVNGDVLRTLYPRLEQVPGHIKEAHPLTPGERDALPDEVFALVLCDGGHRTRKYACVDAGNTALSMGYFLKTAHRLPAAAQKTGAAQLCKAAAWYGLPVPADLEKLALGVGTLVSGAMAVPVLKGTGQEIKRNLAATRAIEGPGHVITPAQLREAKLGEASGTSLMPGQEPLSRKAPAPKAPGIPKIGSLQPHVDVTGVEPEAAPVLHRATHYALDDRYPLDSPVQVKAASAYFDRYAAHFAPEDRRTFACALAKRAEAFGLPLGQHAARYSAGGFGPPEQWSMAVAARRQVLGENKEAHALLDQIERLGKTKVWKEASSLEAEVFGDPEQVAGLLGEFDKTAGIAGLYDQYVPDPYASVFGQEKSAAEDPYTWSEVIGNDMVTFEGLNRLAVMGGPTLKGVFDDDFIKEFRKDPIGIFNSMPRHQKLVLMRMAATSEPGQ